MHAPAHHDPDVVDGDAADAAAAVAVLAAMASRPGDASDDGSLRRAQNAAQKVDAVLRDYFAAVKGPEPIHLGAPLAAPLENSACLAETMNVKNDWLLVAALQADTGANVADDAPIGRAVAADMPEWPDDSMLSVSQLEVARHVRQQLPGTAANPTPFLVIGGPGTGKTFVAKYLADCCATLGVGARSAALAASAAGLLSKGCTLHTLVGLGGRKKAGTAGAESGSGIPKDFTKAVPIDKLRKLRNKFQNVRLLIIDELSMVPVDLLGHVNHRLQVSTPSRTAPTNSDSLQLVMDNTLPFGGLVVVMMGDFDQLPPVMGQNAAALLMALACSGDVVPVGSAAESALTAFKAARTFFLTEQQRCSDTEWLTVLNECRASGTLAPISGKLTPLTSANSADDALWRSATVATFGNRVRQVLLLYTNI
jgi:hypothetical protein